MNDPSSKSQPPLPYPPPRKPLPVALVVFGVVGLLIVLAVAGGIKAFHAVKAGASAAITIGNSFMDSIGHHNYSAARTLMTAGVQSRTPISTLQDVETLVEKHHGAYVAHGQPQWFIQNNNGQTSVRLTYPVQFTRSTSTVSMIVVQTSNGYQVYDTHYEF